MPAGVPLVEVMVAQHHPRQRSDFGTISVYLARVLVEVPMFVMRLSASGRERLRPDVVDG